ncbi:43kDa postsynaptic protein [Parasponia andersonii]|uniref:43kDa postsynaptic protein n=1 Tax=Parasponia andersonii TaxID=3476 RepID=A0A2P5D3G0_PARAD|nr:43kDa postsynaptic protein [Parasponia andersonii]
MESVASNSSPPPNRRRRRHYRPPIQPFADRVVRALHHDLRLLHRCDTTFFVLGATANVYSVTLSATPYCTCPDRTTPCKHILFVLIRALGVSLHNACLRRRTLRPCQLNHLLAAPTLPESLAGAALRRRFHQLFFDRAKGSSPAAAAAAEFEDGTTCPVCLEEMGKEERVVACGTCRNPIHEECLLTWKRSTGRRSASCVICRARWRDRSAAAASEAEYLNLAAYVNEDDGNNVGGDGGGGSGLCSG